MRPPKYRFYITVGEDGERTGVTPHYSKLQKTFEKEDEQMFFRAALSGDMVFVGYDFELLWGAGLEDTLRLTVTRYDYGTGGWDDYFTGTFRKVDCKFDLAAKTCTLSSVDEDDGYADVLDGYDNTYDLITLAPPTTAVTLHKRCAIQVYILGSDTISTFFNGTYMEEDVDEQVDDADEIVNTYHFALTERIDEFTFVNEVTQGLGGLDPYSGLFYKGGSANTVWQSNAGSGIQIRLEIVYTAGSAYHATIATAYVLTTAESHVTTVDYAIFAYDIYKLNLYAGDTLVGTSDDYFIVLDTGDIYISDGFEGIAFSFTYGGVTQEITGITEVINQGVYERLLCDADTVSGLSTYDLDSGDFVHSSDSNFTKCIGTTGVFGEVAFSARTTAESTKYGKNDSGEYFTDDFLPSSSGYSRPLPVCRSWWVNTSVWYVYNDMFWSLLEPQVRKEYQLEDCWHIADVISALLAEIAPDITHEATEEYSQFLYGTPSLKGASYSVFLAPKSNVLVSEYDTPAQKAETSLETVMEMLRDVFKCYWYIEDGKFKIEHIYFFKNSHSYTARNTEDVDLTALTDMFNGKPVTYHQSEIEYDTSELAKRVEFGWGDEATEIFDSVTMDIESNYVEQDQTDTVDISDFASDVDFMIYYPDNFDEDGFALLCPVQNDGGGYEVPVVSDTFMDSSGRYYEAGVQNYYASFTWLCKTVWRYDAPAATLTVNTVGELSAGDIKKCMESDIDLPYEEDIDPDWLVRTDVGVGSIEKAEINIDTRMTSLELRFYPE